MSGTVIFPVAILRPRSYFDANPFPGRGNGTEPRCAASRISVVVETHKGEPTGSQLRTSSSRPIHASQGKLDEPYLGFDTWLPVMPNKKKINEPRSVSNAASLAYLGDCIYELYARRHFLYPPLSVDVYNSRVMSIVRCEAQAALLKKLLEDDFLTEQERDILRWGRNNSTIKTRTRKRAGVAVYRRASSLETLIGHLHLTDVNRLDDLMQRLGFSTGCSSNMIVENVKQKNVNKESCNSDDHVETKASDRD